MILVYIMNLMNLLIVFFHKATRYPRNCNNINYISIMYMYATSDTPLQQTPDLKERSWFN